jgi:two-component system OmpR family sensor kinase
MTTAPLTRAAAFRLRLESIPLRSRLIAVLSLLTAVALVLTTAFTAYLLRRDLVRQLDQDLSRTAAIVAHASPNTTIRTSFAVLILPTDGQEPVLSRATGISATPAIPTLPPTSAAVRTGKAFTVGSSDADIDWRVVAGELSNGAATFAVATPLTNANHTVNRMLLVTGLTGLAVLVACATMGFYLIRRAFRPLNQIEDTAAAIAEGDLTQRIPTRRAEDEVSSLSRSLNAMLAQIEQSFAVREASEERMHQFVSDASHELRTPLATVRGYAELYRQGAVSRPEDVASAMGRIEGEATRMGGLVEDLLTLARLDEEPTAAIAPVDLTVLAADATQDARALAPERRISLQPLGPELGPVVVEGTESRLRQVFANLLANAVRHTPSGTPIEVVIGTNGDGEHARIEVRDHGNGIDDATARRVFERFYRSDFARSRESGGSGLGLAIVAAIVAGHDGRVGVAHTLGGGATFVVELPTGNSQPEHTGL